jgi:hypothetical protein
MIFINLIVHCRRPIRLRLYESVNAMSAAENCSRVIRTTMANIVTIMMKRQAIQSNRIAAHRLVVSNK